MGDIQYLTCSLKNQSIHRKLYIKNYNKSTDKILGYFLVSTQIIFS